MLTTYTLHHSFSHHPEARFSRERCRLARRLDRLAADAVRRSGADWRYRRPIIDPSVAATCVAPAAAIAAVLRDPKAVVQPHVVDSIRRFLTDGCESPLYGRNAAAALLAVADLERSVTAPPPPPQQGERVFV